MKAMILAAFTALSLGMSVAAFAQGLPASASQQDYGAAWSTSHSNSR